MTKPYGPTSTCRNCGNPITLRAQGYGFTQWNHDNRGVWASTCEPRWAIAEPIDEEPIEKVIEKYEVVPIKDIHDYVTALVARLVAMREDEAKPADWVPVDQDLVNSYWPKDYIKRPGVVVRVDNEIGKAAVEYKWAYDPVYDRHQWVKMR